MSRNTIDVSVTTLSASWRLRIRLKIPLRLLCDMFFRRMLRHILPELILVVGMGTHNLMVNHNSAFYSPLIVGFARFFFPADAFDPFFGVFFRGKAVGNPHGRAGGGRPVFC